MTWTIDGWNDSQCLLLLTIKYARARSRTVFAYHTLETKPLGYIHLILGILDIKNSPPLE